MRILHTSDWHLGKKLKEHSRINEFREFLCWLEDIITQENIDALIVAGDIFDTRNPTVEAQEMYYTFLGNISGKSCRHVVITAGNHDSAPFIDAPAGIMGRCNVQVIGQACSDEIITLNDKEGGTEAIICAVPFLHENDLITQENDGEISDTEGKIRAGIMRHYAEIFDRARKIQGNNDIPIIATGHLFLEAGKTQSGEGERSIYVGTAINVGSDIFPEDIAYTALGHLHSPQYIGRKNIRYSGSPIALTFGELGTPKTISIVDIEGKNFAGVREIYVPIFQRLERVSGESVQEIGRHIQLLGNENVSIWLEVTYTGNELIKDIQASLDEYTENYPLIEILSIRDEGKYKMPDKEEFTGKTLDDITPVIMFEHFMESRHFPEEQRKNFKTMYNEILHKIEAGE